MYTSSKNYVENLIKFASDEDTEQNNHDYRNKENQSFYEMLGGHTSMIAQKKSSLESFTKMKNFSSMHIYE